MEMQSSSTVIITREPAEQRATAAGSLLRINAAVWLAGLALSFLVSVPVAMRYEISPGMTLLDGRAALDFEHYVTREHPYRSLSLNSWSALEYLVFKEGKPGLIVGNDGWLFSSEEFPLPSQREPNLKANIGTIRTVVEQLAAQGIRVILLPIPEKAELYSDYLPDKLRSRLLPMAAIGQALNSQGLEWIPIEAALQQARRDGHETFFRTETHWTAEGARVAARATRDWLAQQATLDWERKPYTLVKGSPRLLESDLENYLPVRPLFSFLLPPGETYQPYSVSAGNVSSDEQSLFAEGANPVALVGTSYSADERWNFPGWLRMELGTDIDNISEKGKGPFVSMERFQKLASAGRSGAKVVIWEMPVRTLGMKLTPKK